MHTARAHRLDPRRHVRHRGGDAVNQRLLDTLNASGALYLTHTRLRDQLVLRLAIGAPLTQRTHVEAAWRHIREAAPPEP